MEARNRDRNIMVIYRSCSPLDIETADSCWFQFTEHEAVAGHLEQGGTF